MKTPRIYKILSFAVIAAFIAPCFARADITSNLVLHYALDDSAANTTVTDTGSAGSNGTASANTSALHVGGRIGTGAFALASSSSQYFDTNYKWSSSDHSFTFAAWIKTTQTGYDGYVVGSYNGQNSIIEMGTTFQGYAFCSVRDSSGNSAGTSLNARVNNGVWHFLVCTDDGTTMNMYSDGTVVGTGSAAGLTGDFGGALARTIDIGQAGNGSGYFGGTIDDVRAYSRALTQADVLELGGLDAGLFGWWKFDEGTGGSAADSSGNGDTGTLQNSATWTAGKIGAGALSVVNGGSGSGSYVSTANLGTINVGRSLAAWVYPTDLTGQSGHNIILSGSTFSYWIEVLSNGHLDFHDINGNDHEYTGATIPTNQWTFVSSTCDFGTGSTTLFINGSQVKQDVGSYCNDNSTQAYDIGTYGPSPGNYGWTGYLDDVRIYERTLTASDVSALYALGNPPAPSGARPHRLIISLGRRFVVRFGKRLGAE